MQDSKIDETLPPSPKDLDKNLCDVDSNILVKTPANRTNPEITLYNPNFSIPSVFMVTLDIYNVININRIIRKYIIILLKNSLFVFDVLAFIFMLISN
ncbi:hypothetical protein JNE112863_19940 [Escherichia coli]